MQVNLVHSSPAMEDGRPTLARALEEVCAQTGFIPNEKDAQVRFAFTEDKTWRKRIFGSYQGQPASLRLESHRLPVEEETIRDKFRNQAGCGNIFRIRPPHTIAWQPFDAAKGYGWSLDECGGEEMLFPSGQASSQAAAAFAPFWRELWMAVRKPFWFPDVILANDLSQKHFSTWRDTSSKLGFDAGTRHAELLGRMQDAILQRQAGKQTSFMHAHLAGSDIRLKQTMDGKKEWLVFANHFWSWRQPGYDIAFAIWSQWMSIPPDGQMPQPVEQITAAWMDMVRRDLSSLVDPADVECMLLGRCIGSLLLDLPTKRQREPVALIDGREQEICAQASRFLAS